MNTKANRVDDRGKRLYQKGAGERIEAELTELREQPLAMQEALLASRMEANLAEARRRIDEIRLAEKDFGWLADLRLIALCELAGRAEDLESEEHLKRAFLKRQPPLFEPDHAFNFNILSYQEKLKPMARTGASRQAGQTRPFGDSSLR